MNLECKYEEAIANLKWMSGMSIFAERRITLPLITTPSQKEEPRKLTATITKVLHNNGLFSDLNSQSRSETHRSRR